MFRAARRLSSCSDRWSALAASQTHEHTRRQWRGAVAAAGAVGAGVAAVIASDPARNEGNVFEKNKPVFTYFDLYGRGEAVRMALVHSGTDFEDNRVTGESWKKFKASGKCNNGQVPVFSVDGQHLNQSEAIIRFVGSQTGAYDTSDPFAMWAADAVINTCSDFEKSAPKGDNCKPLTYGLFSDTPMSSDKVTAMAGHRKKLWSSLQVLLGDKKFFGGSKPSIADFWVAAMCFSFERNTKGRASQSHVYAAYAAVLSDNAVMTAWADRMEAELKDYLRDRRPGTM